MERKHSQNFQKVKQYLKLFISIVNISLRLIGIKLDMGYTNRYLEKSFAYFIKFGNNVYFGVVDKVILVLNYVLMIGAF